jgi:amidophosphoribosyltransferase
VVSEGDCVADLFYGTDYHSHLGTRRGGLAVHDGTGCTRFIHDITNAQFRSKFEQDVLKLQGQMGIGVISDTDDQPLIIGSHLGNYAIVTVGRIANMTELVKQAYALRSAHFSEMSGGGGEPDGTGGALHQSGRDFCRRHSDCPERHRRILFDAAADRQRGLRRPR